ncbi:MAG: ArsC family reductase [Gammaproteobacteria bacterium]
MITLYGIPNCDSMKKARAWLAEHQVDYRFHDYKQLGIDEASLRRWAGAVGWEALLNRRGTTWRRLPGGVRETIDEASALRLMAERPALIKRPVLEVDGAVHVGFDAERYARALA